MNPKLPHIKAKELISVILKLDFEFERQSGSHAIYYRECDKRRIVIPIHPGKVIKPKTLRGIIKDIGLRVEEFVKLI